MRKKMKAAWFLAALLSAGLAAFPAMAAQGWAQENSSWVYYDSNGNKVYNEWKKGADGQWRYLNGEGYMAVNAWADSDYYVDSNGIMVTDKWLKTTSDGGEEEWYYFGSSGKTIDDTWKKINDKWYHFDGNAPLKKRNNLWWETSFTSAGNLTSLVYAAFGKGFKETDKKLLNSPRRINASKASSSLRISWKCNPVVGSSKINIVGSAFS